MSVPLICILYEGIEEADFLMLSPCHRDPNQRYDVMVCSMEEPCRLAFFTSFVQVDSAFLLFPSYA
jgi:hypothetical protein